MAGRLGYVRRETGARTEKEGSRICPRAGRGGVVGHQLLGRNYGFCHDLVGPFSRPIIGTGIPTGRRACVCDDVPSSYLEFGREIRITRSDDDDDDAGSDVAIVGRGATGTQSFGGGGPWITLRL